jgi:uncharacterized protein YkwD
MRRLVLIVIVLLSLIALVWQLGNRLFSAMGPSSAPELTKEAQQALLPEPSPQPMPPISEDRALPGEVYTVELAEAPAMRFAAGKLTESDTMYAGLLAGLGHSTAIYDANLGHAARELAYQHSIMEGLLPQQLVDFLLRSAGAIDKSVIQAFTSTTGSGIDAVQKRLQSMLAGMHDGKLVRVGVGEAYVPGAQPMHYIAVLLSRREIEVASAPRRVELGGKWQLTGVMPLGFSKPSALVLRPEGGMETVELTHGDRRFSLTVPVGHHAGEMHVSFSAEGPFGPQPLLQLPVVVGGMPPTELTVRLPPDESRLASNSDAEDLAFELLNADRKHFELPTLILDRELSQVARSHSVDMRDNNFFGHLSINTGSPGDRMAAAGYRASTHAENVAKGSSIHGAEQGLLKSLGHRRNILNPRFTHVGIGVAGKRVNGSADWHLTQLFAVPVEEIDPRVQEARIFDRLNDARGSADLSAMTLDIQLSGVARVSARRVAAGATDGVPKETINAAKSRGLISRGAYVSVQVVVDPLQVSIPEQFLDIRYQRVGVGVMQLRDHPQGLIGVVILVTGGS